MIDQIIEYPKRNFFIVYVTVEVSQLNFLNNTYTIDKGGVKNYLRY